MWERDRREQEREGYCSRLAELHKLFNPDDLPELVWAIAASDAEAEIVETRDIIVEYSLELSTGDEWDLPQYTLDQIRDTITHIYLDIEGRDHLAKLSAKLWQLCGEQPSVESNIASPASRSTDSTSAIREPANDVFRPNLEWGRGEPGEPGPGLQSRRRWTIELYACKTVKAGATALGAAVIEPSVDVDTGEFWLGLDRMSELTGQVKSGLALKRAELVREGWLVDTGKRKGNGTVVYRIAIPSGCEKCGPHDRTLAIPPRVV